MSNMNLPLLVKIASLGRLGYEPTEEVPVVVMSTNAHEVSHLRPRSVLVDEAGISHVDARIVHELEQDLHALISACGVKVEDRPLHELVPYAAERVGMMTMFYDENQPTEEDVVDKPVEEVEDEQPLTD